MGKTSKKAKKHKKRKESQQARLEMIRDLITSAVAASVREEMKSMNAQLKTMEVRLVMLCFHYLRVCVPM